jgi:hypothetical protein
MNTRNRSEGWTHAKLSGHSNEEIVANRINTEDDYKNILQERIGKKNKIDNAVVGGLNETNVLDVFGGKTKSKTDLIITWDDGEKTNISIKKSTGGQVYLIGVSRFINGYESQFNQKIDFKVKRSLELFFGTAPDIPEILKSNTLRNLNNEKIKQYEKKKNRLTWTSLKKYDPELADKLIEWFRSNIKNIATFCFASGLSKSPSNWAQYVWYKNEVDEAVDDYLFEIKNMAVDLSSMPAISNIEAGTLGGGTTIQLPFGFVQWHQGQIQFHHNQDRILTHCTSL